MTKLYNDSKRIRNLCTGFFGELSLLASFDGEANNLVSAVFRNGLYCGANGYGRLPATSLNDRTDFVIGGLWDAIISA